MELCIPRLVPVDKPANAYPIWPMELYAINLLRFFWPIAAIAPNNIEAIERKIIIICHWSIIFKNGTYKILINTVNAAIFGSIAKKIVTEVGDPS